MTHLQVALALTLQLVCMLACRGQARQLPLPRTVYNRLDPVETRRNLIGRTVKSPAPVPSGQGGLDSSSPGGRQTTSGGQATEDDDTDATARNGTVPGGSGAGQQEQQQPVRCPSCGLRNHQRSRRIESIKEHILRELNLKEPPNVTVALPKIIAEEFTGRREPDMSLMQGDSPMHDQYRMSAMDYETALHNGVTTKKLFTFARPTPPDLGIQDPSICFFDVQDKTDGYVVAKATLYFYIQPAKVQQTTVHLMSVSRVIQIKGRSGLIKLDTVREEKIGLSTRRGEWKAVEITDVVDDWIENPSANAGLKLELYDDNGNSVISTIDEDAKKPFLRLKLHDVRRRRSRRAAGLVCTESQPEERCCRFPLRIVFADFQWDWILVPKAYDANYCSGVCPRMRLQQYSHTYIVSRVEPAPDGYSGPCCSASEMSSIDILYFDNNADIKFSRLPNMKVESCSCA